MIPQYLMANLQKGSTTVLSNSFLWELVNPQYKRRKKVPGIANPQTIMIAGKKRRNAASFVIRDFVIFA